MAIDLLAVLVIEDLGRDDLDAEFLPVLRMLPNIDENDGGLALIFRLKGFDDGRHHLADYALIGPEVHHGYHAFCGCLRYRCGLAAGGKEMKTRQEEKPRRRVE